MALERVKLRTAVDLYLTTDATFLAYAPKTQRGYARTLDILTRVTPSQVNACDLKVEHIDKCLKNLRDGGTEEENKTRVRCGFSPRSGRSEASLGNDIKALKAFIRFLHRRELMTLTRNPTLHLMSNPDRAPRGTIEDMIVQPDEGVYDALLNAAGERHPRDRAVMALGLWAGLRDTEMRALLISGVDFDKTVVEKGKLYRAPEIRVYREKNDEWHVVPMHHRLEEELRLYFKWLEGKCGPLKPNWYVVGSRLAGVTKLSKDGRLMPDAGPLHPESPIDPTRPVWTVAPDVKAAFKRAGFPELYRMGAHTLRRMAAIDIADATGDIRMAMHLLGQKSQNTTEIYLRHKKGTEALRRVMRDLAPAKVDDTTTSNVVPLKRRGAVA